MGRRPKRGMHKVDLTGTDASIAFHMEAMTASQQLYVLGITSANVWSRNLAWPSPPTPMWVSGSSPWKARADSKQPVTWVQTPENDMYVKYAVFLSTAVYIGCRFNITKRRLPKISKDSDYIPTTTCQGPC